MTCIDPQVPPALVPAGSIPRLINSEDKGYVDLPTILTPNNYLITRWEPTPDERSAVLRGEDIYITLRVNPDRVIISPMIVTVGPCDWTLDPT